MEIILSQDIDKLGKSGQIVKVKDGFARNFLIPNGLAVPLNAANLKALEQQRQKKIMQLAKVRAILSLLYAFIIGSSAKQNLY